MRLKCILAKNINEPVCLDGISITYDITGDSVTRLTFTDKQGNAIVIDRDSSVLDRQPVFYVRGTLGEPTHAAVEKRCESREEATEIIRKLTDMSPGSPPSLEIVEVLYEQTASRLAGVDRRGTGSPRISQPFAENARRSASR